jgi:2-haloacid dehalogenase
VAFVSANGWDCSGASAFGFQVIHVNRFGQRGERLGFPPAHEITNLLELPGLLPQWA